MNRSIKLSAFAKANLSLNIVGKSDGMHILDSVMVSVDRCDYVTVTERDDALITVKFDNADINPDNNTAYRAAKAVRDALGGNGWDITVTKGIPIGAGLGGSSADGAAVLRALDLFYRLPKLGIDMRALALSVGSDVPFMLTGGSARVRGKGDDLFFFQNKLDLFGVGLMAGSVSTGECYAKFDKIYSGGACAPTDNDKLCGLLMDGKPDAVALFGNALAAPAAKLDGEILENAETLRDLGAAVNLTGSGGMVIGWFTELNSFGVCISALEKRGIKYTVMTTCSQGIIHST